MCELHARLVAKLMSLSADSLLLSSCENFFALAVQNSPPAGILTVLHASLCSSNTVTYARLNRIDSMATASRLCGECELVLNSVSSDRRHLLMSDSRLVIEVKGLASAIGSTVTNQQLAKTAPTM